jgi:hypothetical protein
VFVDAYASFQLAISVIALVLGAVVLLDFFGIRVPRFTIGLFLFFAVLASATDFGLPSGLPLNRLRPLDFIGVMALAMLSPIIHARFIGHLPGPWDGSMRRSIWASILVIGSLVSMLFFFAYGIGAIAMTVLAGAIYARCVGRLQGAWRSIYVIGVVWIEFLLIAVGVVHAFAEIPALYALAPTQLEPPVVIAQAVVAGFCVGIGILAERSYRPKTMPPSDRRPTAG